MESVTFDRGHNGPGHLRVLVHPEEKLRGKAEAAPLDGLGQGQQAEVLGCAVTVLERKTVASSREHHLPVTRLTLGIVGDGKLHLRRHQLAKGQKPVVLDLPQTVYAFRVEKPAGQAPDNWHVSLEMPPEFSAERPVEDAEQAVAGVPG